MKCYIYNESSGPLGFMFPVWFGGYIRCAGIVVWRIHMLSRAGCLKSFLLSNFEIIWFSLDHFWHFCSLECMQINICGHFWVEMTRISSKNFDPQSKAVTFIQVLCQCRKLKKKKKFTLSVLRATFAMLATFRCPGAGIHSTYNISNHISKWEIIFCWQTFQVHTLFH